MTCRSMLVFGKADNICPGFIPQHCIMPNTDSLLVLSVHNSVSLLSVLQTSEVPCYGISQVHISAASSARRTPLHCNTLPTFTPCRSLFGSGGGTTASLVLIIGTIFILKSSCNVPFKLRRFCSSWKSRLVTKI